MKHFYRDFAFRAICLLFLFTGFSVSPGLQAQSTHQDANGMSAANLSELKGSVLPWAKQENDLGIERGDLELKHLTLILKRTSAQQTALNSLLAEQQNPSSAQFHKWLTPAEFGAKFGPSDAQVRQIVLWLQSYGFVFESVSAARNLLTFSGTHAQVQAAFHTELHRYRIAGQEYMANSANPKIPSAFASLVAGFVSLNNYPPKALHTKTQFVHKDASSGKWNKNADTASPEFTTSDQGYTIYPITPYDFATIYNVKPLWDAGIDGTGQTIAIVSDSDINSADIDAFRSMFGLPEKKLNLIYPSENPGPTIDESEADLDVEWSGAVAKNATIDLVVGNTTLVSNGVAEAIAYIVNNNLASIMSVSYGSCEADIGASGNLFFSQAWEQAAAQGITVMVAAGDTGSAGCDFQYEEAAQGGLTVSGWSSTPYNVSVGGTDFYQSYANPTQYWNATNDPTTLSSALSYIPESIWNDSCANPHILAVLQGLGLTDASNEALCNDARGRNYLDVVAGSGGASSCIQSDGQNDATCGGGYRKPVWQSGVPGIPQDGVRDLPDVSLMAGNGLWGTFYLYCESDSSPGGVCDVNTAIQGAGGTSFASPAFAGIMALAAQKTQQKLGNVNYILYTLAAQQYANSALQMSCLSGNAAAGNACMFYDVTDGTNAVPCQGTADCITTNPADIVGILSGYNTAQGFDLASGLGSVNAYNLVENWSSATATTVPTSVALAATSAVSVEYGHTVDLSVAVTVKPPATGSPTGDVAILSDSPTLNGKSIAFGTLTSGQTSITASYMPVGNYNIYARYAGTAGFAPSVSSNIAVIVSQGVPVLGLTASRTTLAGNPNSSTLRIMVTGNTSGFAPTGTVGLTDTTTNKQLGSATLQQNAVSANASEAVLNVTIAQLASGANTISAVYSGDANYSAGTAATAVVTTEPAFTIAINPANLSLASTSNGGSATVTVTPTPGASIPASLNFTCPANLPAGLACSFGPLTNANGVLSSQLSIQLSSPLSNSQSAATSAKGVSPDLPYVAFAALLLFGICKRRRIVALVAVAIIICGPLLVVGCGGGGSANTGPPPPSPASTRTTLATSSSAPALNSPITLTATVRETSGSGTPSGAISFLDRTTAIGTGTLTNGVATFTTSSLAIGQHSITASYKGTSIDTASTSSASTIDVTFSTQLTVGVVDNFGNTATVPIGVTVN